MFTKEKKITMTKIFLGFISLVLFFYLLFIGAEYIVPFVIALLLTMLILWLQSFYKRLIKNGPLSLFLSIITYIFIFWMIAQIINSSVYEIIRLWPDYKIKFEYYISVLKAYFHVVNTFSIDTIFDNLLSYIDISVITNLFSGITLTFKNTAIVFIYTLFLLVEAQFFPQKMNLIFSDSGQRIKMFAIIQEVKSDLKLYFLIRTILSLFTGLFTYVVLILFGLDFALFWGFIAFVFNFIPAIGSIIAVAFPIIFSLVQFDSLYLTSGLLVSLMLTQFCFGNLIEPKLLGNRLNISPIFIILSLGFWSIIWGFVGMLLCVPIMVILNAVLSKIDATKPIAILFSEKGIIRNDYNILEKHKQKVLEKIKARFKKK